MEFTEKGETKIKYKKNYTDKIKQSMENLETYTPEFDKSIEILNEILNDLYFARGEFKAAGGGFVVEFTNKNGSTNLVKNPHYQVIADLSDRALKYLNELGLTPTGLKKIRDKKAKTKTSKLDSILSNFDEE